MLRTGHDGQGLVEYGLVLLLIALAVFGSLLALGPVVAAMIQLGVDAFP